MQEETEEEFLERYALAAAAAGESIEVVEEGDLDEETQDIELGKFLELFHGYIFVPKKWDGFMTIYFSLWGKCRFSG